MPRNTEAHQTLLESPMAKKCRHTKKITRIALEIAIGKNCCCRKKITLEQFLNISVHADMNLTIRGLFQPRNCKNFPFVVKSIWESNCKRFRNTVIRENFNIKPDRQMKKTHSKKRRSYIYQHKEVKEKLYPFSFIYV